MAQGARTEFAAALNQVCSERNIDPEVVLETIKAAILAAYHKDYPDQVEEDIDVELNAENGEVALLRGKKDITPPGFGRIAAQTAKQVIIQRIREAEKTAILSDYEKKVGIITNGMIQRVDGSMILVDLGKAEAIMPPQEQVFSERYRPNQRMTFYVIGIQDTNRGQQIVVSRSHKGLVEGLFRREVPEVASGIVEIKGVAREAGGRSKVAVFSTQPGVDPVGSCVGQKGVRVQAVIAELGEEKVDVIQWNEDEAKFIAAALSPAKNVQVNIDQKTKEAKVIVLDDQLSLAIGRDGQNVRLAAKLTSFKIDIQGESQAKEDKRTAAKAKKAKGTKEPKEPKAKKVKVAKKTTVKKITKVVAKNLAKGGSASGRNTKTKKITKK